ncbi:MAG: alpha-galactosidase, partial [Anaerolineae bacterium]|nr:alpha-galactosidase [Anaerolineae bacterium]
MLAETIRERIANLQEPLFSFTYDGKPSSSFLAQWQVTPGKETREAGKILRRYTFASPDHALAVTLELTEFPGSPVLEWLLRFRNNGKEKAPLLENVQALDVAVPQVGTGAPSVLHSFGCTDTGIGGVEWGTGIGNYSLQTDMLQVGSTLHIANKWGGKTVFSIPFFNVRAGEGGLIGAVGWPGQYLITITRPTASAVLVKAGMDQTRIALNPGEEIRTPLILVLPWEGDLYDAHNTLRRHILHHHMPHLNGEPAVVPISHGGWGGMKTATALRLVEQIARDGIGYENFWMDAGWYGADREVDEFQVFDEEDWFLHAGNWRVNRVPHPQGLSPISEAAHAKGMKYLLWFEIERAVVGTPLTLEHPEWFIGEAATDWIGHKSRPYVRFRLFNFGNPDARRWMTDLISQRITELKIDIFRQDCNFSLPEFWRAADTPSRQGLSEIRYVEGILEFWDELLGRHPGLMLDITQRGDLETISRGMDLTRSDYPIWPEADPMGNQAATMGLAHWRPHFGTWFQTRPGDTYYFRSAFCPGVAFSTFNGSGTRDQVGRFTPPDFPFEWARTMVRQLKKARPYYYGDYYPLTACSLDRTQWAGYQMHRPDLKEGMVLMLRRSESSFVTGVFPLRGLNPDAEYEISDEDT